MIREDIDIFTPYLEELKKEEEDHATNYQPR